MYQGKLAAQKMPPSEAGYAAELSRIVKALDQDLPSNSRVLVMSPPPLGERPGGLAWRRGERWAEICKEVVSEVSETSGRVDISYGPLYERVADDMVAAGCEREFVWDEVWPQCITSPARLLFGKPPFPSQCRHNGPTPSLPPAHPGVSGSSFGEVSAANGWRYTTDGIHFGPEFRGVCERMVGDWLDEQGP